jgi:tRNA threonylcarbamoyladenosine biosynthesis protein TsaB
VRILAIETTAFSGSLALLTDDRIVGEMRLPEKLRSAQSLAPAIESLLSDHAWPVDSLQLIAVVQGPGSFTGLRIGVTTAKTLAYAVGCDVIGIDTLEILAAQASPTAGQIHAILDAQRSQLFAAAFTWPAGVPFPLRQSATSVTDLPAWLLALRPQDAVIGPLVGKLSAQLSGLIAPVDMIESEPRATAAGRLAFRDYQAGRRDSLWTLAPHYHRSSAAEEKRAATPGSPTR